jgi:hypothetical protein
MKRFILSWIIALSLLPIGGCGQTKEDQEIISIVKNGFPLTYQVIDKNARDKWGTNEKRINLTISNECECFVLVGNMLLNPEKNCDINKKAFGALFILATLENTNIKDLSPEKMFECIKCMSFDERFSCMDLNWNGVLKSLVKQIIEYKKIEEKEIEKEKNKTSVFV